MTDHLPGRPPLATRDLRVPPGWRVEVVAESGSTNADVAARARDGELPGLVLVAEHQSAGRGRLDRTWVTPPRSALTVSLLVTPEEVPAARWPWLPLLTGLAVADAVTGTGVEAGLKWPNDVLVDGRKVAGILVERLDRPAHLGGAAAVVGVGVNVSMTAADLAGLPATSLLLAGAATLDRSALLSGLLHAFTQRYGAWRAAAGQGLRASYEPRCMTVGSDVRVALPGGMTLSGRCVGIDDDGRLLVDDGTRVHALGAGDVVHVRPDEATAQPEER